MSAKNCYRALALLLAMVAVVGCSGEVPATATPQPPVAATEAPSVEATVSLAPAPTEDAAAEAAQALKVAVDTLMSGMPNDYMAMGNLEEAKAAIDGGAFLIDVRDEGEYAQGHLAGATNIPLRELAQNLDKIPSDQPVLVYCASSLRTSTATAALRLLGYDNVTAFPGGCTAWSDSHAATSTKAVEAKTFTAREVDPGLLAAVDAFLGALPDDFNSIGDSQELQAQIDGGAVLIDVREAIEYADGAIPGALNIPIRTVAKSLDQIPSDKPVIVYCASGHRAAVAGAMLHVLGYDNVQAFPGGYGAWEAAQGEGGDVPTALGAVVPAAGEVVAVVDAFLSGLPDNFRSVGNLEAFKEALGSADPLLIDVREADEYAAGHIEGAINIPLRTLADNLDKVPSDRPVIVYCASGHRSGLGTAALAMLGYGNVRAFPGGWHVWSQAGEPVATDSAAAASVGAKEVDPQILAAVGELLRTLPVGYLSVGDVDNLKAAIDAGAAVIDVRETPELAEGQIAGAVNLPIRTLGQRLEEVAGDKPVIVYCASGHRAAMATAALRVMGYDNVYAFPAGYGVWQAAGEATE
jgi:rhodanese-related sulfurtransferase